MRRMVSWGLRLLGDFCRAVSRIELPELMVICAFFGAVAAIARVFGG